MGVTDIAADWDSASKKSIKILGPKAKIPKLPAHIGKTIDETSKEYQKYKKVREEIEAIILKAQDDFSAVKNAVTQFSDKVGDEDFELDPKNKDDAKKIADAQKLLGGVLSDFTDTVNERMKGLRELNKHLDELSKYKGPSG